MNENENTPEIAEDDFDAWDSAWDEAELSSDADEEAETGAENADPENAENADRQNGEEGENTDNDESNDDSAETDQFQLKHFDEVKTVNRDEVIVLAQKGMDYDRIRGKFDELTAENGSLKQKLEGYEHANEQLGHFKSIAEAGGMSLDELIVTTLASQRAAKNGTSLDAEIPNVKLELERKAFEKEKSTWEKGKGAEADLQAKINADLEQFAAEFPDAVKDIAKNVPQEVWDAVNAGNTTLTAEYRKYDAKLKAAEIESLKSQLEAAKQNEKNKNRSTGSQGSGGTPPIGDLWDRMWAED